MATCDLKNHARACASMYRLAHGRPDHPCNGCETGRERAAAGDTALPPNVTQSQRTPYEKGKRDRVEAGGGDPNQNDYHNEKKEAAMATDKQDAILKRIQNEKRCTKSRLMNFCGATSDQVASATKALEAEGKIKVWPGIREGAVIYTLPGIDKNYEPPVGEVTAKNDATVPSKPPRRVNRTVATPPTHKPRAKSLKPTPAEARTSPAAEGPVFKSLFEVDLRFVGMLQERAGRLMGAIASDSASQVDGELLDLFCLTTDWLRERRATA